MSDLKNIVRIILIEAVFLALSWIVVAAMLKVIGRIAANLIKINFNQTELFTSPQIIEQNLNILSTIKLQFVGSLFVAVFIIAILYSASNWLIWRGISRKGFGFWRFVAADFSAVILLAVLLAAILFMFKPIYFAAISLLAVALFWHCLTCLHIVSATKKPGLLKSVQEAFSLAATARIFVKAYCLGLLVIVSGLVVAMLTNSILGSATPIFLFSLFYIFSAWVRIELFRRYNSAI